MANPCFGASSCSDLATSTSPVPYLRVQNVILLLFSLFCVQSNALWFILKESKHSWQIRPIDFEAWLKNTRKDKEMFSPWWIPCWCHESYALAAIDAADVFTHFTLFAIIAVLIYCTPTKANTLCSKRYVSESKKMRKDLDHSKLKLMNVVHLINIQVQPNLAVQLFLSVENSKKL